MTTASPNVVLHPRPALAALEVTLQADASYHSAADALLALNDRERMALHLVCINELSYGAAADAMALEKHAFVQLLLDARRSLMRRLAQ